MRLLRQHDGRSYWAIRLGQSDFPDTPFQGKSYPCLIWNHEDKPVSIELARALVKSGCRYAVCGGFASRALEASVDQAFLCEFGTDETHWGNDFVMTTAHANESPDDVAHFFVLNTNFETHKFTDYLLVHVGDGPVANALEAAVWRYAAPTRPTRSLELSRDR